MKNFIFYSIFSLLCLGIIIIFINNKKTIDKFNNPESADKNKDCSEWAKAGECSKNPNYMLKNCKTSCESADDICWVRMPNGCEKDLGAEIPSHEKGTTDTGWLNGNWKWDKTLDGCLIDRKKNYNEYCGRDDAITTIS